MRSGHLRNLPISKQTVYVSPIGPLRKGMLTRYGYRAFASVKQRHAALVKALRDGKQTIMRRLRAIATLTKRTIPRASRVYIRNRNWVKKHK